MPRPLTLPTSPRSPTVSFKDGSGGPSSPRPAPLNTSPKAAPDLDPLLPSINGIVRRTSVYYDAMQQMSDHEREQSELTETSRVVNDRRAQKTALLSMVRSSIDAGTSGLVNLPSALMGRMRSLTAVSSGEGLQVRSGSSSRGALPKGASADGDLSAARASDPTPFRQPTGLSATWSMLVGNGASGSGWSRVPSKTISARQQSNFVGDGQAVLSSGRTLCERLQIVFESLGPLELLLLATLGVASGLIGIFVNSAIRYVGELKLAISRTAANWLVGTTRVYPPQTSASE